MENQIKVLFVYSPLNALNNNLLFPDIIQHENKIWLNISMHTDFTLHV